MAVLLLVASSSYCYSDITYGVTPNAAATGTQWDMGNVLYDASPPWITLDIGGLAYRYTLGKPVDAETDVHIRNENPVDGGYVFEHTDNWPTGNDGGTITKYFRFPYINSTKWGPGEIAVEGEGTVSDAIVTYNYKLDINEELMVCTITPLLDPECPGYEDALYKYLESLETELTPEDPYYDEWVQSELNKETDKPEEEEQVVEEEEEQEEDLERQLGAENTLEAIVNTSAQNTILEALAQVPKIEPYYIITIPGGEYQDKLKLEDKTIPDNRRALRNLASDANHKKMVRSQYD